MDIYIGLKANITEPRYKNYKYSPNINEIGDNLAHSSPEYQKKYMRKCRVCQRTETELNQPDKEVPLFINANTGLAVCRDCWFRNERLRLEALRLEKEEAEEK